MPKEAVFSDVQRYRYHVNDGITAVLTQPREDLLCLVRAKKIVCQNVLHALNALLNDCLIIRTAILSQQKLQHINRDIGPFLDFLCQVFTNDPAIKVAAQLLAQFFTGRPLRSCPSFSYGIPASSVSESEVIRKCNVHNDRLPPLLQTAFFVINHETNTACPCRISYS